MTKYEKLSTKNDWLQQKNVTEPNHIPAQHLLCT